MPYYNDDHHETLNGRNTYTFTVPATHKDASKLTVNGHVLIQDLDGFSHLFVIKESIETNESNLYEKTIFAESVATSELLGVPVRHSI